MAFLDTSEPLEILLLILNRRRVIAEAVSALWIVEHLDIVEDVVPGLVAANVDSAANALPLESLKKLFATALSWQLPRRLMLCSRLCALRKSRQS